MVPLILGKPHVNKTRNCKSLEDISWAGPPPTNSGISGIYKDPHIITITFRGHY